MTSEQNISQAAMYVQVLMNFGHSAKKSIKYASNRFSISEDEISKHLGLSLEVLKRNDTRNI